MPTHGGIMQAIGNTVETNLFERLARRDIFMPREHGAWIWWVGPFLIGAVAGGNIGFDLFALGGTVLAAYLLRHVLTLLVKILAGRRSKNDLMPAAVWAALYAIAVCVGAGTLLQAGYGRVLYLGAAALPVLALHLWLISQRKERGQTAMNILVAVTLALAGPAAYWVSGGTDTLTPCLIWVVMSCQASASILQVAVRLDQRFLTARPESGALWRANVLSLAHHIANLGLSVALAYPGLISRLVPVAFSLLVLEAVQGAMRPPIGKRPIHIGLRQLIVSTVFVIFVAIGYMG